MTSNEITYIAPPGIGEVLSDTTAYQVWALSFPVPVSVSRVRRPGRVRRRVALFAAVAAAAGLALAGRYGWGVPR
jgi:hypothetical protein